METMTSKSKINILKKFGSKKNFILKNIKKDKSL